MHLLRPQQYIKNIFVFMPMFFSARLGNLDDWLKCLLAFVVFSLTSGAVYVLNDIRDAAYDRLHPVKRHRPVASGAVSAPLAWAILAVVLGLAVTVTLVGFGSDACQALGVLGLYLVMNIAYSFGLKRVAIVDVFVIALGFVLRLVLGGVVCGIWLSPWIVSLTFLLTLWLAFSKRRDDLVQERDAGIAPRKASRGYNLAYMNQVLAIVASVTMVCYIIYTVQPDVVARFGTEYVYVTSVFVLAGMLRYLQIALVDERSGNPTDTIVRDRFIHLCIAGWIISFVIIIYR